jgi:hypothetical protein
MSAQAPAVVPGIDNKHDINGVEDIEQDVKGETDTRGVIVTEDDVSTTSYYGTVSQANHVEQAVSTKD